MIVTPRRTQWRRMPRGMSLGQALYNLLFTRIKDGVGTPSVRLIAVLTFGIVAGLLLSTNGVSPVGRSASFARFHHLDCVGQLFCPLASHFP
jgi:hypothetical protein